MSWRDRLKRASFAGVEFYFDDVADTRGHRLAVFNPAGGDDVSVQRLGAAAREFTINGYLLGTDPHADSDLLSAAVVGGAPADFVHPFIGEFRCVGRQYVSRDDKRAGGVVKFTLELIVVGDEPSLAAIELTDDGSIAGARARARQRGAATASAGLSSAAEEAEDVLEIADAIAVVFASDDEVLSVSSVQDVVDDAAAGSVLLSAVERGVALSGGGRVGLIQHIADSALPSYLRDGALWRYALRLKKPAVRAVRATAGSFISLIGAFAKRLGERGVAEIFTRRDVAREFQREQTAAVFEVADNPLTSAASRAALLDALAASNRVIARELPALPALREWNDLRSLSATAQRLVYRARGETNDLREQTTALLNNNTIAHPLLLPPSVNVVVPPSA